MSSHGSGYIKVLNLKEKKTRKLQPVQAYSRLYYDDPTRGIKATIAQRWAQHVVEIPEDATRQGPPLHFRNKILTELYNQESDEIKAKVDACRTHGFPDSDDSDSDVDSDVESDINDEEVERRAKASAYQRYALTLHTHIILTHRRSAQNSVPRTMTFMLEQLEKETGLVGTILLGGPEPKRGGKILVMW